MGIFWISYYYCFDCYISFTLRIGSGFVWWNQYGQGLITLLVVVGIIAIIVAMTKMGEGGKK